MLKGSVGVGESDSRESDGTAEKYRNTYTRRETEGGEWREVIMVKRSTSQ